MKDQNPEANGTASSLTGGASQEVVAEIEGPRRRPGRPKKEPEEPSKRPNGKKLRRAIMAGLKESEKSWKRTLKKLSDFFDGVPHTSRHDFLVRAMTATGVEDRILEEWIDGDRVRFPNREVRGRIVAFLLDEKKRCRKALDQANSPPRLRGTLHPSPSDPGAPQRPWGTSPVSIPCTAVPNDRGPTSTAPGPGTWVVTTIGETVEKFSELQEGLDRDLRRAVADCLLTAREEGATERLLGKIAALLPPRRRNAT